MTFAFFKANLGFFEMAGGNAAYARDLSHEQPNGGRVDWNGCARSDCPSARYGPCQSVPVSQQAIDDPTEIPEKLSDWRYCHSSAPESHAAN